MSSASSGVRVSAGVEGTPFIIGQGRLLPRATPATGRLQASCPGRCACQARRFFLLPAVGRRGILGRCHPVRPCGAAVIAISYLSFSEHSTCRGGMSRRGTNLFFTSERPPRGVFLWFGRWVSSERMLPEKGSRWNDLCGVGRVRRGMLVSWDGKKFHVAVTNWEKE